MIKLSTIFFAVLVSNISAIAQVKIPVIYDTLKQNFATKLSIRSDIPNVKTNEHSKIQYSDNAITNFYKIYPNPSNEKVNLKVFKSMIISKVEFYNMTGQKIEVPYTLNSNIATVDVHNLISGCYITRVYQSFGIYTLPLIVRH